LRAVEDMRKPLNLLAHPTRFERVAFAFGGQLFDSEALVHVGTIRHLICRDGSRVPSAFCLETAAKLLSSLEAILAIFSKRPLKSLNNQADFDSAIRRFDPSRPSQRTGHR